MDFSLDDVRQVVRDEINKVTTALTTVEADASNLFKEHMGSIRRALANAGHAVAETIAEVADEIAPVVEAPVEDAAVDAVVDTPVQTVSSDAEVSEPVEDAPDATIQPSLG